MIINPLISHSIALAIMFSLSAACAGMDDAKPSVCCTLRVDLPKTEYSVGEKLVGSIRITNDGAEPVAVAKPRFPTVWRIIHTFEEEGKTTRKRWRGGVIQGTTHSGASPRYSDEEYVVIDAKSTYTEPIDITWYLRNQRPAFPPGRYSLTFRYDHPPTEGEKGIPLIPYGLESNMIEVVITDLE